MKSKNTSTMIAHNLDFDINILYSEMYRKEMYNEIAYIQSLKQYCSMKNTTDIVQIPSPYFPNSFKWPTLKRII